MSYNDDRPGMMRVHIADQRARAISAYYSRDGLRDLARRHRIRPGSMTKSDLAFALACAGAIAPGYDKAAER